MVSERQVNSLTGPKVDRASSRSCWIEAALMQIKGGARWTAGALLLLDRGRLPNIYITYITSVYEWVVGRFGLAVCLDPITPAVMAATTLRGTGILPKLPSYQDFKKKKEGQWYL